MKNQVQLITYVDRLGGGGLRALADLLDGPLRGLFGGVHLLPFFHAIDGADAGFDPIDHTQVDPRLGTWQDLAAFARTHDVMADVIVNHMSIASPQFQDYSARGADSAFDGLFLTVDAVFPQGASEQALRAVYRPRPGLPLTPVRLANGEQRVLWTTFTPTQVDIDVQHPQGRAYLQQILRTLSDNGVRMIRLDAAGYAIKKAGESCFMMPETFAFIDEFAHRAGTLGMEVLVEIHAHFRQQIEIAAHVDRVYDFALPPLVLHALWFRTAQYLKAWIRVRPENAVTVLDTHDGIGIIDVGVDPADREQPGLVPPAELDQLVERIHQATRGESRLATGASASNLDLYQVNCTFYDALGRDELRYLTARAIQFFLPGVPQVYYVGLLGGTNDMELLARTRIGRDINRHHYSRAEVEAALAAPVVSDLLRLIRFRNSHPAFAGEFELVESSDASLVLRWVNGAARAELIVQLQELTCEVSATRNDRLERYPLRREVGT